METISFVTGVFVGFFVALVIALLVLLAIIKKQLDELQAMSKHIALDAIDEVLGEQKTEEDTDGDTEEERRD